MSALPSQLALASDAAAPAAPQSIDPGRFVSVREAARLLGCNRDHLSRRCRDELSASGIAVHGVSTSGGNPGWFIARLFDQRLQLDEVARVIPADYEQYSKAQRELAWARWQAVKMYTEARTRWAGDRQLWLPKLIDLIRQQQPKLKRISESSLHRWWKLCPDVSHITKLIDSRGGDTRSAGDPAAWKYFTDIYLDQKQPSMKLCWKRTKEAATAEGWQWPAYSAVKRMIDKKITPQVQAFYRSPKLFASRFEPYSKMDPEAWPAGVVWIGDHCQLDLWVRYEGTIIRPWLTTWMDWRSRKVVGWVLSPSPNSGTILAALRAGILEASNAGGPDVVYIDNGKDYYAFVFHGQTKSQRKLRMLDREYVEEAKSMGLYEMLDIDVIHAMPFNAKAKGRLERWFGTMHRQFDVSKATYAGCSPEHRPPELVQVLKHPHLIPSFESIRKELAAFIACYNDDAEHSKDDMRGMSANQMFAQHCPRVRVLPDPGVLDYLLMSWHKPVRVGRNGVTIAPVGGGRLSYGAHELALIPHKGKEVRVSFDHADYRTIRVYTMDWRFICTTSENQMGRSAQAVGREHVSKAIADNRAYRKAQKVNRENYSRSFLSISEQAMREPPKPPPMPEGVAHRLIQTPLDGEGKAIEREELRKAAGAENLPSLDDLGKLLERRRMPGDDDDILDLLGAKLPISTVDDANDDELILNPWDKFPRELNSTQRRALLGLDQSGKDADAHLLDDLK